MKLYYPITVDLYNPHPLPRMNAQQHNVGRGAIITLTANGQVIVPDEESVRIFAKRPDKNVSYLDCSIVEGKIQADFTDQMLATEGNVEVELELTTAETNITTPIFIVEVNKSNVKEGVQSSNEYKALEKYTAEAKEAAEQAQEVYDNIPNYEAILEANSILSKASGEVVTTTDSAKVKPKNIKLFGKGKQRQYEGYQLIPFPYATTYTENPKSINGLTIDIQDDGRIKIKGTATSDTYFNLIASSNPRNIAVGEYYALINADGVDYKKITIINPSGTVDIESSKAFSVTEENATFYSWIGIKTGTTVNTTVEIMVSEGSEPKPYEPYVGNEPSPSINYPQKAEFLGESGSIGGKVLTGNLYNPSYRGSWVGREIYSQGCEVIENDGVFKITVTKTDAYIWDTRGSYDDGVCGQLFIIPNSATEVSVKLSNIEFNKHLITYYNENKVSLGTTLHTSNKFTSTIKEGAKYFSLRFGKSDAVVGETYETTVMVNYVELKDYEPYTEQPFTALTPNGLRGVPLGQTIPDAIKNSPIHMSGVYWDKAEGQYYIADTENEDGKDVQRIGKVDNDNWKKTNVQADTNGHRFVYDLDMIAIAYAPCLCTHYTQTNKGSFTVEGDYISTSSGGVLYIRTLNTDFDNIDDFKAHVKEVGMETYYILAEPIITDTTEEEKAQLDKLVMNYPNTTIVNDEGAYMEVEYVCDTKEHIKQNYTPKSVTEDILERLGNVESQIALNS